MDLARYLSQLSKPLKFKAMKKESILVVAALSLGLSAYGMESKSLFNVSQVSESNIELDEACCGYGLQESPKKLDREVAQFARKVERENKKALKVKAKEDKNKIKIAKKLDRNRTKSIVDKKQTKVI